MDDEPEPTAKAFYDMFDAAQKPLHGQTKPLPSVFKASPSASGTRRRG